MTKPRVAVIGTGGTIASIGKGPLDILDYGANETMLHVDEIIARFPEVHEVAEVLPIRFEAIPSPNVFFPNWKALVVQIETLAREHKDLAGIVVTHGTASLEETAYFLNLTLHVDLPVVVVGSQRPAERPVNRCRYEPRQRRPHRRRGGLPWPWCARTAERRDPRGAGGHQNLDLPSADIPLAGLRRAGPCGR